MSYLAWWHRVGGGFPARLNFTSLLLGACALKGVEGVNTPHTNSTEASRSALRQHPQHAVAGSGTPISCSSSASTFQGDALALDSWRGSSTLEDALEAVGSAVAADRGLFWYVAPWVWSPSPTSFVWPSRPFWLESFAGAADTEPVVDALGGGSYGAVVRYVFGQSCRVAIKRVAWGTPESALLAEREFLALRLFRKCPHVVELFGVYGGHAAIDPFHVYFVTEICDSDLHGIMAAIEGEELAPFTLVQVRSLMAQLLEGLAYVHEHSIVHRDLKPASIFLNGISPDSKTSAVDAALSLKIGDFGMSREIRPTLRGKDRVQLTGGRAQLDYRAPEVLLDLSYSDKIDMWAAGCIFSELLTFMPGVVVPQHMKDAAVDLLAALLDVDPHDRLPAAAASKFLPRMCRRPCSPVGRSATAVSLSPEGSGTGGAPVIWRAHEHISVAHGRTPAIAALAAQPVDVVALGGEWSLVACLHVTVSRARKSTLFAAGFRPVQGSGGSNASVG
eukprot:gene109-170_t